MLIELVGPAGSGKTTIARQLDRILCDAGLPVMRYDDLELLETKSGRRHVKTLGRAARTRLLAGLCWRHPRLMLAICALVLLAGPQQGGRSFKRRRRYAWRAFGHVLLASDLRRQGCEQILIFHEGFTQLLWTLLIDSRALRGERLIKWALRDYHAAVGQRSIRLMADDETIRARAFSRVAKGRFSRESTAQQRQGFDRWLDYHRRIVRLMPAEALHGEIDVSRPSDQVAGELAMMIKHEFAEQRAEIGS